MNIFIKPAQGRQVPDPARGDLLPPEGRSVESYQYWQRRIAEGDVVEAIPADPVDAAIATTKKAKE
jgi:hypothetical protein